MPRVDEGAFLALAADALHTTPGALELARPRGEQPEWDSLGHVMLVLAVEEQYGVRFEVAQMEKFGSLGEILGAIEAQ